MVKTTGYEANVAMRQFLTKRHWIYIEYDSRLFNKKLIRLDNFLPPKGHVGILCITDKQFGMMELFYGRAEAEKQTGWQQLELF